MIKYHHANKSLATLATTNRSTSRYFLNEKNELCGSATPKLVKKRSAALQKNIFKKHSVAFMLSTKN